MATKAELIAKYRKQRFGRKIARPQNPTFSERVYTCQRVGCGREYRPRICSEKFDARYCPVCVEKVYGTQRTRCFGNVSMPIRVIPYTKYRKVDGQ